MHLDETSGCIYACPTPGCGYVAPTRNQLQRHVRWEHSNKRRYYCTKPGCGFAAKQASDLRSHRESHRRAIRRHMENTRLPTDHKMPPRGGRKRKR